MRTLRNIAMMLLATLVAAEATAQPACTIKPEEHIYRKTPSADLKAYVFRPQHVEAGARRPAMLVLHGGGWTIGEPAWGFWQGERYACRGMVVIVAQYRLSGPGGTTPVDAVDDTRHVLSWARQHADEFSLDRDHIAALGWSAGGHLAASAALLPGASPDNAPNALLLISPALSLATDAYFQSLLGKAHNAKDWSPADHVHPGLPPSIIVIGRTDTVTPLVGATLFHDRMLAAGNESHLLVYEGVGHMFTPSSKRDDQWPDPDHEVEGRAYKAIDAFLEEHGYLAANAEAR